VRPRPRCDRRHGLRGARRFLALRWLTPRSSRRCRGCTIGHISPLGRPCHLDLRYVDASTRFPFDGATFDLAFSVDVVHYITELGQPFGRVTE
jgi:hypothetical protein